MAIQLKVDDDLPAEVGQVFERAGHDAIKVFTQKLTGSTDDGLWKVVQADKIEFRRSV